MAGFTVHRRRSTGFVALLLASTVTVGVLGGFWGFLGDLLFGNRSNNETPSSTQATTAPTQAPEAEPMGEPKTLSQKQS